MAGRHAREVPLMAVGVCARVCSKYSVSGSRVQWEARAGAAFQGMVPGNLFFTSWTPALDGSTNDAISGVWGNARYEPHYVL